MKTTQNLRDSASSPLADAWAELQVQTGHDAPPRPDAYRLAFADPEFMLRRDTRGIRFQLELLKPELDLHQAGIESTVVVYGSARCGPLDQAKQALAAAGKSAKFSLTLSVTGGGPSVTKKFTLKLKAPK